MSERVEGLWKGARAGDPAAYQAEWEVDDSRFRDREPEVMVSRSLRVSVATYERVRSAAARRGMSPSALMRQWIEEGAAAAQDEHVQVAPDPVSLVDRLQSDVARLARVLRNAAA